MSQQWIRKYSLIIGDVSAPIFTTETLQITFNIKKGLSSVPNQAKINVFNLSKDTRDRIREDLKPIILIAGYESFSDIIFQGDIRSVGTPQGIPDIGTEIQAGDGDRGCRFGSISYTVEGGRSVKDAITQLANSMPGVQPGILKGLDGKTISSRGVSVTGDSKTLLDSYARQYGFTWSIQDGILETVAAMPEQTGSTVDDAGPNAFVISPKTGMIDQPEVKDEGKVTVKFLLNPRVKPGRVVNIESLRVPDINGFYRVNEVEFIGDYSGQDWYTSVTGVKL